MLIRLNAQVSGPAPFHSDGFQPAQLSKVLCSTMDSRPLLPHGIAAWNRRRVTEQATLPCVV